MEIGWASPRPATEDARAVRKKTGVAVSLRRDKIKIEYVACTRFHETCLCTSLIRKMFALHQELDRVPCEEVKNPDTETWVARQI